MNNSELLDTVIELLETGGASTDEENKKLAGLIRDALREKEAAKERESFGVKKNV